MPEGIERERPEYAQNLTELRRDAELTHVQLAKLAGLSLDEVCEIERGVRRPDTAVRQKLLVALRYDPEEFDDDFRPRKGKHRKKEFQGGKQKHRDPDFGINDPDFWHWWHREGKDKNGGEDIKDRDEARRWYTHWQDLGCPVPKVARYDPDDRGTP